MHVAQGKYFMDGADLWTAFGVLFGQGAIDAFLKQPKRKPSLTHDWQDSNGIDVDLSKVFFEKRDLSIRMGMIVNSEADFFIKYAAFFAFLAQPGLRRLTVRQLKRDFFVYYADCTDFNANGQVAGTNKKLCTFTLTLTEPAPTIQTTQHFIIDENGRFIIT
jgi:hypothetical protein